MYYKSNIAKKNDHLPCVRVNRAFLDRFLLVCNKLKLDKSSAIREGMLMWVEMKENMIKLKGWFIENDSD